MKNIPNSHNTAQLQSYQHIMSSGNLNSYTVQCLLHGNLFYSRFYIFLFGWFWFVLTATLYSLAAWLVWLATPHHTVRFVTSRLRQRALQWRDHKIAEPQRSDVECFVRSLTPDGVLALRLLHQNSRHVTLVDDVIGEMWRKWCYERENDEDVHAVVKAGYRHMEYSHYTYMTYVIGQLLSRWRRDARDADEEPLLENIY